MRWCKPLFLVVLSAMMGGCGDEAHLKEYSEPMRVVNRAERYFTVLQDKLASPDYSPANEAGIAGTTELVNVVLPYSLTKKLKDASARQQIAPKLDQLQQVFGEEVRRPIYADPPQLDRARTGVQQCLDIIGQMKGVLGS